MRIKLVLIFTIICLSLKYNAQTRIVTGSNFLNANKILNSYILNKYMKNENPKPSEYKSARKFFSYDIDQDGDNDLIAFFTLEGFGGGNNWQHYISIFVIENKKIKVADDLVLYGDMFKEYHDGELVGFKNGYVYYKLYGEDNNGDRKINTIGITIYKNKIATNKTF